MISVSSDIVSALTDSISSAIQQLWVVFALLIGVVIALFIIRKIIFMFYLAKR